MVGSIIQRLRRIDEQRRSFPGEHWLVAAAGMWFLKRGGLASKAIGGALLYRAASGRDGLRQVLGGGAGSRGRSGSSQSGRYAQEESLSYGRAGRANLRDSAPAGGFPDFR